MPLYIYNCMPLHLYAFIMVVIECAPRVNHNVDYGLWVIVSQCGLISFNKCPTLVGDVGNGGGCACGGQGEISASSSQFCCEPKTALKKNCHRKV